MQCDVYKKGNVNSTVFLLVIANPETTKRTDGKKEKNILKHWIKTLHTIYKMLINYAIDQHKKIIQLLKQKDYTY